MKIKSRKAKALLIDNYLDEFKPYLKSIINYPPKIDTLKNQLTIAIILIS